MTRTARSACLRAPVIAIAALAGVAGSAPSARATLPGDPGPIAFQRYVDPNDDENVQIFSVARPGAKARRLTSGGSGYNPDYSPDGRRIVFERRFGGVKPDAIVTMGSEGSSPAVVPTRAPPTRASGTAAQPGRPTRPGSCSSAPSGRSSPTRRRAASSSSPPTPTGAAST